MARAGQPSQNSATMNPRAEPPSPLGGGDSPPPIAGATPPPAHALGAQVGENTYAQVISTAPIETFSPEQLQGADGLRRGQSRPQRDYNQGVPREPPPEVERWVVLQGTEPGVTINGATFRRGKVLISTEYDIDRLLTMGLIMQKIPAGRTAADVLAGRVSETPAPVLAPA